IEDRSAYLMDQLLPYLFYRVDVFSECSDLLIEWFDYIRKYNGINSGIKVDFTKAYYPVTQYTSSIPLNCERIGVSKHILLTGNETKVFGYLGWVSDGVIFRD